MAYEIKEFGELEEGSTYCFMWEGGQRHRAFSVLAKFDHGVAVLVPVSMKNGKLEAGEPRMVEATDIKSIATVSTEAGGMNGPWKLKKPDFKKLRALVDQALAEDATEEEAATA